jgi:hypothetical protein
MIVLWLNQNFRYRDYTLAEASDLERIANILENEAGLQPDVRVESEPIITSFIVCTRGAHHKYLSSSATNSSRRG